MKARLGTKPLRSICVKLVVLGRENGLYTR